MVDKKHKNEVDIPIQLDNGESISIHIISERDDRIVTIDDAEAEEYGEIPHQIHEASSYEYILTEGYQLDSRDRIVRQSKINANSGRLVPNVFVGTISLNICNDQGEECGELKLEVKSIKASYRKDYRTMLEDITEWSTELLMQSSSPAIQHFTIDFGADAKILYQRFAFIKSILESVEFEQAVNRIIKSPSTDWKRVNKTSDIRSVKRANGSIIRQIASTGKRIKLPNSHSKQNKFGSVPQQIVTSSKQETVDTVENRFIKHALKTFLKLCSDFKQSAPDKHRLKKEAESLELYLEKLLSHDLFIDISRPTILPLNSPLLQRKEGYREVLRTWLMFDLAAKLTWQGGNDIYEGGKKDVATLYEYWVFFKLLKAIEEIFNISTKPAEKLIEISSNNLDLKLKQGKYFPLKGVCETYSRKLNVQLSFNKSFTGKQEYPRSGSWSINMRPDYTLSIWPFGINESQAEKEELIVHIHFDAKYKIKEIDSLFSDTNSKQEKIDQELDQRNQEEKEGVYKRADLLKMHSYRDAIRRTGGAYVLYPGEKNLNQKGFHEIIPGLGAFTIRPSKQDDGAQYLKSFLRDVLDHFLNRTSQREIISYHKYDVLKNRPDDPLKEKVPEAYGSNRSLIPKRINVLVAFYKSMDHLKWIKRHGLYNARTGDDHGSIKISTKEAGAKFLLAHTFGETITDKLFRIKEFPEIFSKEKLIELDYPSIPSKDFYLVFPIVPVKEDLFLNTSWDIKKLSSYVGGRQSAVPFSVTLAELMKAKVPN